MNKKIIIVGIFLVLTGCAANYQSLKLGIIDSSNKSISVPLEGNGLFEIKSALIKDGWRIKVADSSLSEKGVSDKKVNTVIKVQYETAYRMYMTSTISHNGYHSITSFNISIVDNKTNEEVLNMVGNRDDYIIYRREDIAHNLIKNMNEIQK